MRSHIPNDPCVEVSKDFYIEGFFKKQTGSDVSITRVKTRAEKNIQAGGARARRTERAREAKSKNKAHLS